MIETNGKKCGICGNYIEMPTYWSGTLPTMCNGLHTPPPPQTKNGYVIDHLDRIEAKLDDLLAKLSSLKQDSGEIKK